MPAPVRAETNTASGHGRLSRSSVSSSAASILLTTSSSGTRVGADLGEHLADRADLLLRVGVRAVDDVHDQVGVGDLLQRRAERLDELVRQVPDEADRVGQRVDPAVRRPRARRVVGSRVANSASSTSTPAPVSRLSRLDLPALV